MSQTLENEAMLTGRTDSCPFTRTVNLLIYEIMKNLACVINHHMFVPLVPFFHAYSYSGESSLFITIRAKVFWKFVQMTGDRNDNFDERSRM